MTTVHDTPGTTPPPPPAQEPSAPQGEPPRRRSSAKVIATIAIAVGAVLVIGTIATGILSVVRTATTQTGDVTAPVGDVRLIDLDVSAANVTVTYGDVSEATLRVTGPSGSDDWRFERDGTRLVIDSDPSWWGRWGWFREPDTAELVLPTSLAGVDADLAVSGGSLRTEGDFGALGLSMDAGSLTVTGTADRVSADIDAGSARVELAGLADADVRVDAGSLEGRLTGVEPQAGLSELRIDVSAGRVDLGIADIAYDIRSDVSAGRFTHDFSTSTSAAHRIDVSVSAGGVTLRGLD